MLVGNKFPLLPRKHNSISRGNSNEDKNSLSPVGFVIKVKQYPNHNLLDVSNFSRVPLLAMNKFNLKNTNVLLQDNLNNASNSIYCLWYSMALDVTEPKIFKLPISKAKRKATTNICKIPFLNEDAEPTNVPCIFHDPSVKVCLHVDIKFDDPTVIYLFNNSIRSKIFYFNKCIYNLQSWPKYLTQSKEIQ